MCVIQRFIAEKIIFELYVFGTFRIEGCLMKIMHTVQLPSTPLMKMMENRTNTKYVS